jgi:FkbM family methyltransferase
LGGLRPFDRHEEMTETSLEALTALTALLDRPLSVVDVGCRWGFSEAWHALADHVHLVGFDPDEQECARLRSHYIDTPNVQIVDSALDRRPRRRTVHLTRDPACSSVFQADPLLIDQVPELEVMAPAGSQQVRTTTLDRWRRHVKWGPVDFIKADVQGAELDVLRGATATLRDVLLIELEVEFNRLYSGQPLFGEVDAFARKHGFQIWRLSNLAHYTRAGTPDHQAIADVHYCDSRPTEWPSPGGQLFWAHALFIATDIVEFTSADWQRPLRAGCLAATLGLSDIALRAWQGALRLAPAAYAPELRHALDAYRASLIHAA